MLYLAGCPACRPRDMLPFGTVELLLYAVAKLEMARLSLGGKPGRR